MVALIPKSAKTPFPIHDFDELDSTNSEAKRLVEQGEREAFVVSTKRQTKGRGRFNRVWHSPESNAAFTICVPRRHELQNVSTLSLATGLAIHQVIERAIGNRATVKIKWPNDIVVEDAKISGTLIETDGSSFFVGIGINLVGEPAEVIYPTTSLRHFCDMDRIELIQKVAQTWDQGFQTWCREGFKSISSQYSQNLWRRGETLMITLDAGRRQMIKGRCIGVNEEGLLMLDVPEMGVQTFATGDVGV